MKKEDCLTQHFRAAIFSVSALMTVGMHVSHPGENHKHKELPERHPKTSSSAVHMRGIKKKRGMGES